MTETELALMGEYGTSCWTMGVARLTAASAAAAPWLEVVPMPVRIPNTLPARTVLERENVFVMGEERAEHQDIRPLRVAILNLMPTKIATETQLLRLLGNTALQVDVTLLHTASHEAKNTDADHLLNHYVTFEAVRGEKFDGLIITGAPVELMAFEDVDYWPELTDIMDWAETNVESTFYVCWGAQAGLVSPLRDPEVPPAREDVRRVRTPHARPDRAVAARLRRHVPGSPLSPYGDSPS